MNGQRISDLEARMQDLEDRMAELERAECLPVADEGPSASGSLRSRLLRILRLPETAYPRAADETLLAAVEEAHESLRRMVDEQALELAALHRRLSGVGQ